MRSNVHCKLSTLMGANRKNVKDVHDATGLSRNTISKLYHDKVTRIDYETIAKLCDYFDCDLGELFVLEKLEEQ